MTPATIEWGRGDRRALLLHGITSSAAGWWRVGPALAELGYAVVAADLRGHGRSPRGDDYRLDDYCGDVLELGTWDVVLGHSLGGAVAIRCQAVDAGFTGRLILEDPVLHAPPGPASSWLLDPFSRPLTPEQVAADHPGWHPTDVETKAKALTQTSVDVVAATAARGWDVRSEMARIGVPTLVVAAEPSLGGLFTPEQALAYLAGRPHMQFEIVAGGSHSMHRDAYGAFWDIVRTYLSAAD